jgi:hypothetical protein
MARVEGFAYAGYGAVPAGIEAITLSDDTIYDGVQGFISDTDGTLAVEMADGSEGVIPIAANLQYTGGIKRFKSTGSTGLSSATISAFY